MAKKRALFELAADMLINRIALLLLCFFHEVDVGNENISNLVSRAYYIRLYLTCSPSLKSDNLDFLFFQLL